MKKFKRTKKLMAAIEVLADEQMADCSDGAFISALEAGSFTVDHIYRTLQSMRFQWKPKRGYWVWMPRHLKSVQRMFRIVGSFEEHIVKRMLEDD